MSTRNVLPEKPSLRRSLGVFDGITLLIGIMIGAGIYSTPQLIAGYLGSFSTILFLWILVACFVFISGLIYAELGTRLPHTGGEYVYISRCFGPFAGFMFGWAQLFIIRTSAAASLAIVTADYVKSLFKLSGFAHTALALSVIVLLGILNYVGIQRASFFQKISTVLKVGGLFALVVIGLILVQSQKNLLSTTAAPTGDLGLVGNAVAAIMLIFFTHTGWDRVGYVAEEMKNPRRVVPLSLVFGIGVVVAVYALTNMVYYRTLGIEGMRGSSTVAVEVATTLIGTPGAVFIALLVIISATGSINGTMMTAPRAYYAMAKDGLFFKWLDFVHPRFQTPSRAILAHCIWASVILLIRRKFETIAAGMVFILLIFLILNTFALFKLRKGEVGGKNVYRLPFYPFLPWFFISGILVLLVFRVISEWKSSLVDVAFLASGLPFSLIWLRRNKKSGNKSINFVNDE
jgi:APA family basic amino acid/polyamine antiporter